MFSANASQVSEQYVEDVFSAYTYTGNGSTQTITNGIDLSTKGGLVWLKGRTSGSARSHHLFDTARGSSSRLYSNSTAAADTGSGSAYLSAFTSTGFSLGLAGDTNASTEAFISWTFRKAAKFFDVVTYTGTGVDGRAIPHSLGQAPGMIIVKITSGTSVWFVYHRSLANTEALWLQATDAVKTGVGYWNSQTPTSTAFYTNLDHTNINGATYVAYLFAHDASATGLIQCGSYTGTASDVIVTLDFEPQFVMIKSSTNAVGWIMFDNMRGVATGGNDRYLYANTSGAEDPAGATDYIEFTATGFKVKSGFNDVSGNGFGYVYLAIRRGPMRAPTSGTQVYSAASRTGTASVIPRWTAGFPVDMVIRQSARNTGGDWQLGDRLRGAVQIKPNLTEAETAASPLFTFDSMTGYSTLGAVGSDTNDFSWMFRRYPGVFDQVCYPGTGSATTVAHNLGVVPELMIVKRRAADPNSWMVYHATLGPTKWLNLDTTDGATTTSAVWNDTTPTSSVFTVGTANHVNNSAGTYVAYLFATLAGISKVGSYTGTGTTLQVDCGFAAGARFVLIKRTDDTGDWYVWDSTRGIIAGNDPYLLLNSTAAEATATDYIDPLAAGFELSSTAPAALNASGGTFIFLAFA